MSDGETVRGTHPTPAFCGSLRPSLRWPQVTPHVLRKRHHLGDDCGSLPVRGPESVTVSVSVTPNDLVRVDPDSQISALLFTVLCFGSKRAFSLLRAGKFAPGGIRDLVVATVFIRAGIVAEFSILPFGERGWLLA